MVQPYREQPQVPSSVILTQVIPLKGLAPDRNLDCRAMGRNLRLVASLRVVVLLPLADPRLSVS